jgi:hypothetical protein
MRRLVHWLFLRGIPAVIPRRFDPDKAGELRATLELRVRDPRGREPARFAVEIAGRVCAVRPGPASDPNASATLSARDMVSLVLGEAGWPELVSSGRLELSGDPFLAMRFPMLFRLPAQARGARVKITV